MNTLSNSQHDQLIMQLPWYANGTLQEREYEQVRDHVNQCVGCQKELESLTLLQRSLSIEPVELPDSQASFRRMQQRINQVGPTDAQQYNSVHKLILKGKQFFSTPPDVSWGLGAMAAVLLAVIVVPQLTTQSVETDDSYRVLGADEQLSGIHVRVQFNEGVTGAEADATLTEMMRSAELPMQWTQSAEGDYRVSIAGAQGQQTPSPDELQNWIDHIQSNPQVVMVEVTP